jgi:glycosyltransferase involved in cell wall biosynthesis
MNDVEQKLAPRVSVLTPVYNAQKYLRPAIESVLAQEMGQFEFVLVDDGSRDDSSEIIGKYAARDGRILWTRRENRGVSATRNELVGMARAPLVAWLDADDVAMPRWLEQLCGFMEARRELVAAGCFVEMMDVDGLPICKWSCATEHDKIDHGHLHGGVKSLMFGSSITRREAILRAGGFDETLKGGEDLDLFLKLGEIGKLACLPEVLVQYRQHLASMCQSMKGQIWEDVKTVLDNARARRGLPAEAPSHTRNITAPADIHRRWAWWALGDHNISTARKHAHRALLLEPFAKASWRTAACAWRGH